MLHLFLSLALSFAFAETSPEVAPLSLTETATKLNASLPEDQKIIVPSQGSRVFLSNLDSFKAPTNPPSMEKAVLKFSELTLQGCNAYSWGANESVHLTEFSKAFKVTKERIKKEGSLPKALQLARVGLTTIQCKGPVIVNAVGAEWLKESVDLLKSIPHRKMKKDDKARLQAFREQVMALNSEKILSESLRFEMVSIAALSANAMKEGKEAWPNLSENVSLAQKPDFWQQFSNGKPWLLNWDLHAKTTNEVIQAIDVAKAPEFKAYTAQIDKQYKEGLEGIWKILDMKSLGFATPEELLIEGKMIGLRDTFEKDSAALERIQKNFSEHPEISNYMYQVSLRALAVSGEFFAKFDKKLTDIKDAAAKLK